MTPHGSQLPRILVIVPDLTGDHRNDLYYLAPFGVSRELAQNLVSDAVVRARQDPDYQAHYITHYMKKAGFSPVQVVVSDRGW